MGIENLPKKSEDIIDIIAKTGYLEVENDQIDIKLEGYNTINVQPKGTPFGAKVKVDNGSVIPTLTFDTKKMRESKKAIDPKQILDDALNSYLEESK